jgi:hypothetical protein
VPCIDPPEADRLLLRRLAVPVGLCTLLSLLAGCNHAPATAPAAPSAQPARPAAPVPVAPSPGPGATMPAPEPSPSPSLAHVPARPPRYVKLGPPATPRNAAELRLQFAQRLVAAHPDTSYTARAPDRLWAIPVLEVELNADGSVRRIEVLRKPTTGNEATQLAIAAVQRAAPYGEVSRLPKPWKVVETFLFDDELRFKPRTLD